MNNLDPEVAERPDDLVVYGGTGKAARIWEAFDAIVASLRALEDDETLLVQSGKPVARLPHASPDAPRVLIANANLVPKWADWDTFRDLEDRGLTMYGQMTAGSWIYIGTQGILQGTYETLAELARRHFGGTLAGRVVVTAGLGGMGGAQPLAVTMNDGVALVVEVDPARIERRLATRYLDEAHRRPRRRARRASQRYARDGDGALDRPARQRRRRAAGARARAASRPDVVTDQTSAHDPLVGYVPERHDARRGGAAARAATRPSTSAAAIAAMGAHVAAMLALQDRGAIVFDYGNNIRAQAVKAGVADAFDIPGFVPEYIRPLFCEGKGPFRWVALSGDPEDIRVTDRAALEMFADDEALCRWIRLAGERVAFQGLPARIFWLGYGDRARFGLRAQRAGAHRRGLGADRDRPRSSRHRIGGLAQPRDRRHARRQRRDRRLADPECAARTPRPARPGCRCTTAAASASAIRMHAGMVIVADGTREADEKTAARPDLRPRHRAWRGTPTPVIPKRFAPRASAE